MSLKLAAILADAPKKKRDREEILALVPDTVYDDGRTKQCHQDECDINKIMARFDRTGTISHVNRFEGRYADYSDFDFFTNETRLAVGKSIFDALPGEVRREFAQSPQLFFDHVNHPDNIGKENYGLPALARPGDQIPKRNANTEPTETVENEDPLKDPPKDPPKDP